MDEEVRNLKLDNTDQTSNIQSHDLPSNLQHQTSKIQHQITDPV